MTADIPARTDADIEDDLATRVSVANLGNVRAARIMASALRDEALSLLSRAQKAEAELVERTEQRDRAIDLGFKHLDERDRLRAELVEAKQERDHIFGEALRFKRLRIEERERADAAVANSDALSVENAALRAQVQAVEALRDTVARLQEPDADTGDRDVSFFALCDALASPATPEPSEATPEVCAKPMHKNCGCVRPKGHVGYCNCTYRSAPEGEQP